MPNSSGQTSGDSHMDNSEYSRRARLLLALVKDLTALGGEQFNLDIPCLAFIGNQSAGKSSVVEGATGIPVPRDSGTCTKYAAHPDDDSLADQGSYRCPMQCTLMRAEGAWSCEITLQFTHDSSGKAKTQPLSVPFKTVSRPKDVEVWLRRAQAAILSPDTDPSEFHSKTTEEMKNLQTLPFSQNSIDLLVRDPEGTDLRFVDLPGIIQHHTKDDSMVSFVKNLVEMYVKRKNTLIVVTIPMTDDIENQEAFSIASRADKAGLRTIGVGTKPDMLTSGSLSALESWKRLLEGTQSNLKHGYYCVRMPNDKERLQGLSRAQLKALETEFFENTEPWKDLADQSRLGMRNLVENTSSLLISLIETNLPAIRRTVDELLAREMHELGMLPPPLATGNPLSTIMLRVVHFTRTLNGAIHGLLNKSFVQNNQERYSRFRAQVLTTSPDFQEYAGPVEIDGSSSCGDSGPINLDDVRALIRRHTTWELPGYVPFEATKELILQHINLWKAPLGRLFEDICFSTLGLIHKLIQDSDHFGRFAELQAFVKTIVEEEKAHFHAETSSVLDNIFTWENSAPIYTANREVYDRARAAWLDDRRHRHHYSSYSDEYKVMADVHAYFQVASARFIDEVIKCVEGQWHQKLVSRLEEKLIETLPTLSNEKLSALLKEDPVIALRRETLTSRVTQLQKIKARLMEYEAEASVGLETASDEGSTSSDSGHMAFTS
ncbi:hypothetical protein NMY22_g6477 [Coprinellus aureogranulatus]|nr:hypothetical protein NMY22_g6477 [Coprinellus aureogranulatus]